jgi:predicted ester cyclase
MSEDYKTQIEQNFEALNAGKLDFANKTYATNAVYHAPPFPDMRGLEAVKGFIADILRMCPDSHWTVDEVVVQGNTGVARTTYRGTFTGPSSAIPIPPTGKGGTAQVCFIAHWVGGKVAELWQIGDWLGWFQQLGVLPPMG